MSKSLLDVQKTMRRSVLSPDLPDTLSAHSADKKNVMQEKCTFPIIWREAFLPYLGTRIALFMVGLLATFYILPLMVNNPVLPDHALFVRFPQALWMMWRHFDSGFYIDIAINGYWDAQTLHSSSDWAFYPLYPFLMSCVRWLFNLDYDGTVIAGVVISHVASLIAMGYLYALIFKEFGRRTAALTVLYLALFPMSFYLSAVYPEAVFLALAIASLYYARRQSWLLASLCGGLAALSRAQGILLIVPIAWEYLRVTIERYTSLPSIDLSSLLTALNTIRIWFITCMQGLIKAARDIKNWFTAFSLLLIPGGLLTFMLYAKFHTGDLLATFHTQAWGWHRSFMLFIRLLIFSVRNPIMNQPLDWNFWLLNIILAFLFLAIIVWSFVRLPKIYAFYVLVMVLLPLSSSILNSFDRYCMLIFPAFLLLALYTQEKRPALHHFLIGAFAALQAILMLFFVVGLPAIA